MTVSFARRLGVLAATTALGAGTLGVVTTAPAQAAPEKDNARVRTATQWMVGQLTDGLIRSQYGPDHGLSADVALALDALGKRASVVEQIADAVAPVVGSWYQYEETIYTGSIAKAMVLAQTAGRDVNSYGGQDLESLLEQYTADAEPIAGRIENQNELDWSTEDPADTTDTANVIGQSFAARALRKSGSVEAPEALEFLLEQQCSEGFFRFLPTADKADPDQTCNGDDSSVGHVEGTAATVINLLAIKDQPGVASAVEKAVSWLKSVQAADGSFTSSEGAANSNSTGLAGWALGAAGAEDAAERAAQWLLARQAVSLSCLTSPLETDEGAVAVDSNSYSFGVKDGITAADRYVWQRATAQALPALDYLDLSRATLEAPGRYFEDGATAPLKVSGLLPGEQACLAGQLLTGPAAATVTVTLPAATGSTTFTLERVGANRTAQVTTLAAQTFKVGVKKKLRRGKRTLVTVAGLAPSEQVSVRLRKKVLATGHAGPTGVFVQRVKVEGKPGKAKLVVTGEFADRTGAKRVKVLR